MRRMDFYSQFLVVTLIVLCRRERANKQAPQITGHIWIAHGGYLTRRPCNREFGSKSGGQARIMGLARDDQALGTDVDLSGFTVVAGANATDTRDGRRGAVAGAFAILIVDQSAKRQTAHAILIRAGAMAAICPARDGGRKLNPPPRIFETKSADIIWRHPPAGTLW